ncbi:hypothetical protein K504DRAFT_499476 [Pleomassaria siparia CBS 279.74]|uniref:Uncharacterized protein n=1 Tax=Pleomassaria siparia CBS 279.74 TaxID=1314801 RepID=A0A6G1KIR4_9PLEO|nr:hypothetical protein K504DRAFT_499476 [Pleomassaria siparia CBS 279.74]
MKRPRDDDSDEDEERYMMKARPWAFQGFQHGRPNFPTPANLAIRASPPQKLPNLDAMTPTTPSDYSVVNSPASIRHDHITPSSPHDNLDMDMEMDDEDLDMVASPPLDSSFVGFLRPAKLNSDLFSRDIPVNNTGRIPTPIYPNFHAGGMNGLGYPSSGMAGGITTSGGLLGLPSHPILQHARKQPQTDADRAHRIPSPISEDEDLPDTPTAFTQSQLERLSVTSSNTASEHMDLESSRNENDEGAPPPGLSTTPTKGRKRSGAFTGKGRFSMGYRDDCEKCKQRVPGHYSHFVS